MKKILLLILIFLSPFAGTAQYIYTVAGNGGGGSLNDNCMATSASFYTLDGAVVKDTAGNMFIADYAGNRISKISPSGFLTGYAGTGVQGYNGDGISAISAQLRQPFAIALDDSSNLYFADTGNNRIRKVNATTGLIYTVGGNGIYGYTGDSIPANSAEFADAISLAIDHAGNIFIADMSNHRIRKIEAATGMIYTVAGTGIAGYNGDGILATNAQLNRPEEVILDASGNLYIADRQNHRIRKVDYLTGLISTVAGNGVYGYNGDTIPALTANLNEPTGISLDSSGQLYIADSWNGRIRKVDTAGIITTIAGDCT